MDYLLIFGWLLQLVIVPIYLYLFIFIFNFSYIHSSIPIFFIAILSIAFIIFYKNIFLKKMNLPLNKYYLSSLFLLICIFLIQIVSFPFAINYGNKGINTYATISYNTFFVSLFLYLIGTRIKHLFEIFKKVKLQRIAIFLWIIFASTIIYGIYLSNNNYFWNLHIYYNVNENVIGYLSLSDSFAIFTIFTASLIKKEYFKYIILLSGIILLYATFSRSALYIYSFVAFMILLRNRKIFFIISFFLILIIVFFHNSFNIEEMSSWSQSLSQQNA